MARGEISVDCDLFNRVEGKLGKNDERNWGMMARIGRYKKVFCVLFTPKTACLTVYKLFFRIKNVKHLYV